MSFDLGVWHSEVPLTDKEAAKIYVALCEKWPYLKGESPSIAAFYYDLTAQWPEIETMPEDQIDNKEYCPWSCSLNHSGMAVIMACVWSMADDVAAFVEALAKEVRSRALQPSERNGLLAETSSRIASVEMGLDTARMSASHECVRHKLPQGGAG